MDEINFYCISNKPAQYHELAQSLPNFKVEYFDGHGYSSYSKLFNDAVDKAEKEIVIITGDKARPTEDQVNKGLGLLKSHRFGSVQMACLGFVIFYRDLISKIGYMDERFGGGGREHGDFLLRHKEADIAYYESREVKYNYDGNHSWATGSHDLLNSKWEMTSEYDRRKLPEIDFGRKLKTTQPVDFAKYKDSIILTGNTELYNRKFYHD